MARPLRIEYPNALYHVMARGNARTRIYGDEADRTAFLTMLARTVDRHELRCHAYCLMTTHYHLVVETPRGNLSRAMHYLNGVYGQAFNRRHDRVGHLFAGRFKSVLIEADSYLLTAARYVVLNPVRAGYCNHPGNWRWSSFRATAGMAPEPAFLQTATLLAPFGGGELVGRQRFADWVCEGSTATDGELSAWSHSILGRAEFVASQAASVPDVPEIPLALRRPARPPISELLGSHPYDGIRIAYRDHGYRLREIAAHLGVHYSTVSRRLRLEEV